MTSYRPICEPLMMLPHGLQARKRELLAQRNELDRQIDAVRGEIRAYRAKCRHEAGPGTEEHYAIYCRRCGFMMDTWL